jgi:myo-inositol catabolism protein IolS
VCIRRGFADSGALLQTDFSVVYFVQWPNPDGPRGPSIDELEKMRQEGKIRAIGVSNFTADELADARQYGQIDVLQPPYNLFWRYVERREVPYCRDNNIGIMTYSSLAQGLLTGTVTRTTNFAEGDNRPSTVLFQPQNFARCLDAVDQMRPIAAKYEKTLAQVAIHWVTSRLGVSTSLLGARTVSEIEENAGGTGWEMSEADLAEIDRFGRDVFDALPEYPDMFRNWQRWDLQRRRYELGNRIPVGE